MNVKSEVVNLAMSIKQIKNEVKYQSFFQEKHRIVKKMRDFFSKMFLLSQHRKVT